MVSPLQLSDLLLQSLLKLSDSSHFSLLLGSDLLLHIRASLLHQLDHLSEDLLTVLHSFISRAIEGLLLLLKQLHVFLCVLDSLLDCLSPQPELSLPLSPFCCSWHCVVVFMFIHRAEITDTLLISAAEHLHHLIVTRADVLLELLRGLHQLVLLKWSWLKMRLEVFFTIRGQTIQTGLESFQFSPSAEITLLFHPLLLKLHVPQHKLQLLELVLQLCVHGSCRVVGLLLSDQVDVILYGLFLLLPGSLPAGHHYLQCSVLLSQLHPLKLHFPDLFMEELNRFGGRLHMTSNWVKHTNIHTTGKYTVPSQLWIHTKRQAVFYLYADSHCWKNLQHHFHQIRSLIIHQFNISSKTLSVIITWNYKFI